MEQAVIIQPTREEMQLLWLGHFNQSVLLKRKQGALVQTNKALSQERVELIQGYLTGESDSLSLLTDDLSLTMAVFEGTKAEKQSLKRSLSLAMQKATDETYTLKFSGNACTIIVYAEKEKPDEVAAAFDTLGEHIPEAYLIQIQSIFNDGKAAQDERLNTLRAQAQAQREEQEVQRARDILKRTGQKATKANVELIRATMVK